MKILYRILFPAICLSISLPGAAQQKGLTFFKGSWQALLDSARSSDKLIFVDVYTVWCGPCKKMDASVFPLETVGAAYNKDFISYKLDAEKGEGVSIAKKYTVNAYPTFLFINASGDLIYRGLGGLSEQQFIALAARAKEQRDNPVTIEAMRTAFVNGKRDVLFLKKYIADCAMLEVDATQPLDTLFASMSVKEREDAGNLRFFYENCSNAMSPVFSFLLQQKNKLEQLGIAQADQDFQFGYMLYEGLHKSMSNDALDTVAMLLRHRSQLPLAETSFGKDFDQFQIEYLGNTNQADSMLELIYRLVAAPAAEPVDSIKQRNEVAFSKFYEPYLTGKADSTNNLFVPLKRGTRFKVLAAAANELHFGAKMIERYCRNKPALKKALIWNEKARELMPSYSHFIPVTAGLQYKLGRKKEAIRSMKSLLSKKTEGKAWADPVYMSVLEKMEAGIY